MIRRACREAQAARGASFDVNYRSCLWLLGKGGRDFLSEICRCCAILFIGSDDAETVSTSLAHPTESGLARVAPAATIALTLGEAGSAVLSTGAVLRPSRLYTATTVDRVGR